MFRKYKKHLTAAQSAREESKTISRPSYTAVDMGLDLRNSHNAIDYTFSRGYNNA